MFILAGKSRIEVENIIGEQRYFQQLARPALRVKFRQGISDAELSDLKANDWHLVSIENGVEKELSIQRGYNTIESHEAAFVKVDAIEEENIKLKQDIAEVSTAIPTLLRGKTDDTLVSLLKFIPEWDEGKYVIGDVRKYDGQPRICCQAHDSTGNEAWNPTVASLWSPYHAMSREHALTWISPTGAQDAYKKDEYMVFTDGKTYKCLQDTAYSPTDYLQAWQAV